MDTASPLYQSDLLAPYSKRLIHGFTGKPLSMGGSCTAQNPRERVLLNRQNLLNELGFAHLEWIIPQQVHGNKISDTRDSNFDQTDGIVIKEPNKPVMLLFADCVPILLYDPENHAGVVVHAGWRGTEQKIVQEAIKKLHRSFGSNPASVIAVIGPAIGFCCFQVSADVSEKIADSMQLDLDELEEKGLIAWDKEFPFNPRVDLKGINREQMLRLGIRQIKVFSQCTRCLKNQFFSWRRKEYGRNSAFMILL